MANYSHPIRMCQDYDAGTTPGASAGPRTLLPAVGFLPYIGHVSSTAQLRPFLIEKCEIVLPDRVIRSGALLVADGRISYAGPAARLPSPLPPGCARIDAGGSLACPALWEQHIHGCGGISTEKMTSTSLSEMAAFLARRGVGAFLPTTVPHEESLAGLGAAIAGTAADPAVNGRIPGIYVEGPFVAKSHRGAIPERLLRSPSTEYLDRMVALSGATIRMLTYAPELPQASRLQQRLREHGIIPALGHSGAAFAEVAGCDAISPLCITHLFNGMSGVSHKEPGLAHWALLDRQAYTEINCDGTHVHDAAVRLVLRARPWEKLIVISDAVAPAGLPVSHGGPGAGPKPTLYGKSLVVKGSGLFYEDTGVLVGSRFLVTDCLARLVQDFGVPLASAVGMATLNPARLMGYTTKGALLPGYDADVALFSRDFSRCSFLSWEGRPLFQEEP
jgi:N-acetylglucosamine-6-phosphate deacetylase